MLNPKVADLLRAKTVRVERALQRAVSWRVALFALFNWMIWSLIIAIVCSQLLGVVWDSTSRTLSESFGESPLLGMHAIPGENDEPYADRMVVCQRRGRVYKAAQLSAVLAESSVVQIDAAGPAINGYRVVNRTGLAADDQVYLWYTAVCDEIAATLDAIIDSCTGLGYNVTRDNLRIVGGIESSDVYLIPNSLPVLVMPYWDNVEYAHYVIPGWDGSACTFRLTGKYDSQAWPSATLLAPDRSVRESLTEKWLGRPGGVWRNGWYEDPSGMKWYSDIATIDVSAPLGISYRQFDMLSNRERDVAHSSEFVSLPFTYFWGDRLSVSDVYDNFVSVAISNGRRFGLFLYESSTTRVTQCVYDLETLISNTTIVILLFRWMVVMLTLQASYRHRRTPTLMNASVGCLSNARGFLMLPIALLPRLKLILAVFLSAGCHFEGEQVVLSEAWFVVYPGLVEFVLLYFSLINLLARLLRRRASDVLFAPTLIALCFVHNLRSDIAKSKWFGIDGRVATHVSAEEFEALGALDFISSDIALRMSGNATSVFAFKITLLVLNLVPLVLSKSTSECSVVAPGHAPCRVEVMLGFRACCIGGIGRSQFYESLPSPRSVNTPSPNAVDTEDVVLTCYELVRLGYVVLDDQFLMSFSDWLFVAALGATRFTSQLFDFRVLLFPVAVKSDGCEISAPATYAYIHDPRLQRLRPWRLSAVTFK